VDIRLFGGGPTGTAAARYGREYAGSTAELNIRVQMAVSFHLRTLL
jgi:hypothetical protein